MSVTFRFLKQSIMTESGWHERNLDHRILGVVGPVGSGKTSMLRCAWWVLGVGRDSDFSKAVTKYVRAVEVVVNLGGDVFTLRRRRGAGSQSVQVRNGSGAQVQLLPVTPKDGQIGLSDWLLAQLGLGDGFASVRIGSGRDSYLRFAHLARYLWLTQEDIDRHILFPRENPHDARRLMLFALLFGLTNPEWEALNTQIKQLGGELRRAETEIGKITGFLDESQATNAEAVEAEIATQRRAEGESQTRLNELRRNARAADRETDELRARIDAIRSRTDGAENQVDHAREQIRQAGQALARIERALTALGEADKAIPVATTGERQVFARCPACSTELGNRSAPEGCCHLCTRPLPAALRAAERSRLTTARDIALDRLAGVETAAAQAIKERDAAHADLSMLKRELDRRSADVLSPFGDAIARATAEVAEIATRLEMLERLREPHQRVAGMRDHALVLAEQIEELIRQRDDLVRESVVASDLFDDLDERFAHVTQGLKLPWYSGHARVDRETYLPLVDQQQFQQVSHGIRSALSVGYSVALLRYALDAGSTSLPSVLVIDSPKKNVGNGEYDSALAHRIYDNFLEYDDSRGRFVAAS